MSKTGMTQFDRLLASPAGFAPDFQVLVAALSARQCASPTAHVQTLIVQDAANGMRRCNRLVALFADGIAWEKFAVPGCFSPDTATLLTVDARR